MPAAEFTLDEMTRWGEALGASLEPPCVVTLAGDVLRIETGGGGGHGHPFDRLPEHVAEDVAGGFVTAEAAQRLYGVALVDGRIDKSATARLRARRPETKAFHRHAYVDSLG